MNVRADRLAVSDSASAHVALVREDERRGDRADGRRRLFVVVSNRADYQRDVFRVYVEAAQNVECEDAAALRVVASVYHVADIVHVSGDRRELAFVVAVVKYFQYLARHFGYRARMGESVLGEAQLAENAVAREDISLQFFIFVNFIVKFHFLHLFFLLCSVKNL